MKKLNIILTITTIIFSLSNTFAQTYIIKSGVISNTIGTEIEYNIKKSRYSIIAGATYSNSNGQFKTNSITFKKSTSVYRITDNYKIHSAFRIYSSPLKKGMNLYFQPQFSYVKTIGFEFQVSNNFSYKNKSKILFESKKNYAKRILKYNIYEKREINQGNFLGSLNIGIMTKINRFIFDVGIGYQIGKINPQTIPFVGDLKLGYAF